MSDRARVRELPPYRAVLAVDVKNFSGAKAADHHQLTEKIPLVLARAFERSGYGAIWAQRRFPAGRGDGYVVGFRPEVLPILLGPVVDGLQDELAYHHELTRGPGLRMRVSLGVGPLTDSDNGRFADGSGAAMVETHRLLDCDPVRRLLADSDPTVTFVAVVISPRVYDDVVAAGYATKAPTEFIAVPVHVKSHLGTAFLHVPKPSGTLLSRGVEPLPPGDAPAEEAVAAPADGVVNTISGTVDGYVLQSRDLHLGGNLVLGDPPRAPGRD